MNLIRLYSQVTWLTKAEKKNGAKFKFGRAERRYLSAKGVTWWMAVADNVIRQVATAPSKNGRR